jgi:hypothetical protein
VYKAKIGRDAIVDIHVRSLRSGTLLLPSKVDGVSDKSVGQVNIHISSGVLRRFPDRYQQQSAQRFTPAQDLKLQVPPPNTAPKYCNISIRKSPLPTCIVALPSLSHGEKKKGLQPFRAQLKVGWVPIRLLCVQDLDRSTSSHILEIVTGSLALSCRDCHPRPDNLARPLLDVSHTVSFRRLASQA